jgi:hypothetical protein
VFKKVGIRKIHPLSTIFQMALKSSLAIKAYR